MRHWIRTQLNFSCISKSKLPKLDRAEQRTGFSKSAECPNFILEHDYSSKRRRICNTFGDVADMFQKQLEITKSIFSCNASL